MSRILVTGFRPYSLITRITGNPSEMVATALGARYGSSAEVHILNADATCMIETESLGKMPGVTGILMFGANIQASPVVLELEGVDKANGLMGPLRKKINSTGASRFIEYAKATGVPVAKAPATPLVYWCLRSYATALEWAEPRGIPCLFMHVNTIRVSSNDYIEIASRFFEKMRDSY